MTVLQDDEEAPLDQQEDLDDLQLAGDWYTGPSLWSTDWTTETIVSQLRRGNINLNPRFQRRNAWDSARKSLFIESLVMGLPVPQLVLAEEKGRKGSFIVIDGKQRLLTLRQFAARHDDPDFRQLRLSGLNDKPSLAGLTYETLSSSAQLEAELNTFDNQTIRTVIIRGWKDEKYLYSVFLRINTGSVQLSAQELRQALHPGEFSDFIDDISVAGSGISALLKLRQPDFRMRDVELVLRFFAYRNFAGRYNGNLKKLLDDATKDLNARWKRDEQDLRAQAEELRLALSAARQIFGERDEIRKWNGREYEKRINRAVFDIITFFFARRDIRELALEKSAEVKNAFQRLCETNREFLSAIESTTKSLEANRNRFSIWAETLSELTGLEIKSPIADNG